MIADKNLTEHFLDSGSHVSVYCGNVVNIPDPNTVV